MPECCNRNQEITIYTIPTLYVIIEADIFAGEAKSKLQRIKIMKIA